MLFTQARHILNMTPNQCRKELVRGQWVYAGDKETKGRYCGVTHTGIILVSWSRKPDHVKKLMALHGR